MSTMKIVVLIIVTTFVVCGHVEIIAARKFGIEQWLGRWYEIGQIAPSYAQPLPVTCGKYDIRRNITIDDGFIEIYEFTIGALSKYFEGYGRIIGSEMNITILALGQVNYIYTYVDYNGGIEVIINKKDETRYYGLLSRSVSVSETTRKVFDNLAVAVGVKAYYVPHISCTYD